MEFQFGMNWAYYSHYVGDVFGAPLAIEGPALLNVTVPAIGAPAVAVPGKARETAVSASGAPPTVTVAALLAAFGSAVAAALVAETLEVALAGCV